MRRQSRRAKGNNIRIWHGMTKQQQARSKTAWHLTKLPDEQYDALPHKRSAHQVNTILPSENASGERYRACSGLSLIKGCSLKIFSLRVHSTGRKNLRLRKSPRHWIGFDVSRIRTRRYFSRIALFRAISARRFSTSRILRSRCSSPLTWTL